MLPWSAYAARLLEVGIADASSVRAAYGFGSRACGTHSPNSDHDLVLIVVDGCAVLPQPADWLECSTADGQYNFNIYSHSLWCARMNRNELQCFMALACPLFAPLLNPYLPATLVLPHLQRCVAQEASRHFRSLARRHWPKDQTKARKCVFYALRDWTLGVQIARRGRIDNLAAANPLFNAVMSAPAASLADIYAQFDAKYEELKASFWSSLEPPLDRAEWLRPDALWHWFALRSLPLGSDLFFVHPEQPDMCAHARSVAFCTIDARRRRVVHRAFAPFGSDHDKQLHPNGIAFGDDCDTILFDCDPAATFVTLVRMDSDSANGIENADVSIVAIVLQWHPMMSNLGAPRVVATADRHGRWSGDDARFVFPGRLPLTGMCATFSVESKLRWPDASHVQLGPLRLFCVCVGDSCEPATVMQLRDIARNQQWDLAPVINLSGGADELLKLGSVRSAATRLPPLRSQGIVLVAGAMRVLVMSPSVRRLWEAQRGECKWAVAALECIVRNNDACGDDDDEQELCARFDSLRREWVALKQRYATLCADVDLWWARLGGAQTDKKRFAERMRADAPPELHAILMPMRQARVANSAADYLARAPQITAVALLLLHD